jgi:anti-anti-sigma regulatory factor
MRRVQIPDPSPWRCRVERVNGATRLRFGGELDVAVADELDAALEDAQRESPLVVVDLGELDHAGFEAQTRHP